MRFHTDRSYHLPLSPAELWESVSRVENYQSWWPWLRHFDGDRLASEEVWICHVQPPLPYWVRFEITLEEVRAPNIVRASITGDVQGDARLEISDHLVGSEARLISSLEPRNHLLRAVARVAAPLVRFGHDWVLDTGARQFLDRAR